MVTELDVQHFDVRSLSAEVAASGLMRLRVLGDVAGAPYDPSAREFAVIARKPRAGFADPGGTPGS
jgi:hypothetical protein